MGVHIGFKKAILILSRPSSRFLPTLFTAVFASLFLFCSCASMRKDTKIHPNEIYEEMPVQLGMVKPVYNRPSQNRENPLVIAVAISGGGMRAANFGLGALLGLESIRIKNSSGLDLLSEVDLFSTVSGGGIAAGLFISSVHDFIKSGGCLTDYSLKHVLCYNEAEIYDKENRKCPPLEKTMKEGPFDPFILEHLNKNLHDIIAKSFNPFIGKTWKIWFGKLDRTHYLEKAMDDFLLGAEWRHNHRGLEDSSLKLNNVFVPEEETNTPVLLPYWISNAATFENGAIFPFTPEHLYKHRIWNYSHRLNNKDYQYIPDGFNLMKFNRWKLSKKRDDFPYKESHFASGNNNNKYKKYIFDMPLSLGATASGNFPAALPATTMNSALDPENPYLHLLDGGLADNLGVITAIRYFQKNIPKIVKRKLLIVIDAYKGRLGPFSSKERAPLVIEAGFRTTSIFLDSWRGRYREITKKLCESLGIDVVFVSFEDLDNSEERDRLLNQDFSELSCLKLMGKDFEQLETKLKDSIKKATPFDLLRNIPTEYKITSEEQRLLIAAGKLIMQSKIKDLKNKEKGKYKDLSTSD